MAWTQTDVDNLKKAISDGRGARSITFGDRTIVFHSVDEMLKLLSVMQQEVAAAAGTSRTRVASISKDI